MTNKSSEQRNSVFVKRVFVKIIHRRVVDDRLGRLVDRVAGSRGAGWTIPGLEERVGRLDRVSGERVDR